VPFSYFRNTSPTHCNGTIQQAIVRFRLVMISFQIIEKLKGLQYVTAYLQFGYILRAMYCMAYRGQPCLLLLNTPCTAYPYFAMVLSGQPMVPLGTANKNSRPIQERNQRKNASTIQTRTDDAALPVVAGAAEVVHPASRGSPKSFVSACTRKMVAKPRDGGRHLTPAEARNGEIRRAYHRDKSEGGPERGSRRLDGVRGC
jgi:hypothetical protein